MLPNEFLTILSACEKLKCRTRHSDTSDGRRESVAEHSWRLSLMAMLMRDTFPSLDIDKVIRMCLIHDLGEIFTGDIPAFQKTDEDRKREDEALLNWIDTFPAFQKKEFMALTAEMTAMETDEAKLYKALDKAEAIIQHNEGDISSWEDFEYDLQFTHGVREMNAFPQTRALREEIDRQTTEKIRLSRER